MSRKLNILPAACLALALALALSGAAYGGIAVPGYDTLTFAAGTRSQDVDFFNPAENDCEFHLTLALEDGVTLWESGPVRPGGRIARLTLSRALDVGAHPAVLRYDCRSLRDGTPLNGAEIKLTIEVK